jgi:hypothetical protein
MVPGVASLRCPACSRPFLTLPQQEETLIRCPHCHHAAPAGAYAAAGRDAGSDLLRSLRHRAENGPVAAPAPPLTGAPWPAAPPLFDAAQTGPAPREPAPAWTPEPVSEPKTSRFRLGDLKTPRGTRRWAAAAGDKAEERLAPIWLLLLVLAVCGAWLLWLSRQPPLAVDIPAPAPDAAQVTPEVVQ